MRIRYGFARGLLFLLLSVGSVVAVQAGTTWTSPITNAVIWTKAGSPHTWGGSGQLTVGPNGLVTIEPGAVVQFAGTYAMSVSAGGQILAVGTADDPITIGGVSQSAPGNYLLVQSEKASEFRFCHFANLGQVHIAATSPQGNSLFEHCVFRKFTSYVFLLDDSAPVRVLHCIFYDNSPSVQAICVNATSGMSDETAPTIWYNTFDRNGLYISLPSYSAAYLWNHEFFRFNRVASGLGIDVEGMSGYMYNFRLVDCDLGSCNPSIYFGSATYTDMTISRCSISNITGSGPAFSTANLQNNYWGTTNVFVAQSNALNGAFSTNALLPLVATNLFPQADVDGSDGGNLTRPADADLVKKYIVGMTNLTSGQLSIADVDHNGKVDARDALIIESYVNGLIWKLPVP